MTLVSEPAAHEATARPRSRAVKEVHRHLAAHCGDDVRLDVGVLGLPGTGQVPPDAGETGLRYTVRLAPGVVLLGPLYRTGPSAGATAPAGRPCARCLERRWTALRPVEAVAS